MIDFDLKDRTKRYDIGAELAKDIQKILEGYGQIIFDNTGAVYNREVACHPRIALQDIDSMSPQKIKNLMILRSAKSLLEQIKSYIAESGSSKVHSSSVQCIPADNPNFIIEDEELLEEWREKQDRFQWHGTLKPEVKVTPPGFGYVVYVTIDV